jgi:hypothetical protein
MLAQLGFGTTLLAFQYRLPRGKTLREPCPFVD